MLNLSEEGITSGWFFQFFLLFLLHLNFLIFERK